MAGSQRLRVRALLPWSGPVVLSLLMLLPVLTPGYVLVGDMAFVPQQPWKAQWLGLDGSVPRAVPADAIVSVLTQVVPGQVVQKVVLLAIVLLAGWGVMRLLPGFPTVARLAAAALYMWNPYVYERLAIGHWGLLLGYAALPWVVHAATRVREDGVWALPRLWCWLALAAFASPTGGLVAAFVALVVVGLRGGVGRWLQVAGVAVVVNLPWLLPAALAESVTSDATGVQAFAARADTPLGALGSLATFGGIWKSSVVPGERGIWLLPLVALLITVLALAALWWSGRPGGRHVSAVVPVVSTRRLLACGLVGLAVAWLPTTGVGLEVVEWLVARVPGAGLLRDSQKWVLPLVLAVAVGFGLVVARLDARLRSVDDGLGWISPGLVLAPLLLLPSLGWGLAGELRPVHYPDEWDQVAEELDSVGAKDGRLAVLPWSTYTRFPWNDDRASLDPASRFFPGQVVTSEDLRLDEDLVVRGEQARGEAIGQAVEDGTPLAPVLREQGIRWALVEKGVPSVQPVQVPEGEVLHDGAQLVLVDVGGTTETDRSGAAGLILAVDGLVVVASLGALVLVLSRKRRRVG